MSDHFDVVVVRSSSTVNRERRTPNIYKSLSKKYRVLVLGWDRDKASPDQVRDALDGYSVRLKLFSMRSPSGNFKLLFYLPVFWIWIFANLLNHRPAVVHACDLDTVIPCYAYKLILRKKLVFDILDRYAMAFVSPGNKNTYRLVNFLEEFYATRADALLNVSDQLAQTFKRKPKLSETIFNCSQDIGQVHKPTNNDRLIIAFTGHVRRGRGLEDMAKAVSLLDGVELAIAGIVADEELLSSVLKLRNVSYHGLLTSEDALEFEVKSDVMVALYSPTDPINKYAMGGKIFESMMCGIPLITNVATDLIKDTKSGIVVSYGNLEEIRDAIGTLRDNSQLRNELGTNGHEAFLKRYSWNSMEQKLFEIYDKILVNEQSNK